MKIGFTKTLINSAVILLLGMVAVFMTTMIIKDRGSNTITCYAVFENGDTVKVDSIVAVPIWSEEQVNMIWPEYYAETKIKVEGNEIILRSRPFLFCDNPGTEGSYKDRNVYCLD